MTVFEAVMHYATLTQQDADASITPPGVLWISAKGINVSRGLGGRNASGGGILGDGAAVSSSSGIRVPGSFVMHFKYSRSPLTVDFVSFFVFLA